MQHAPPVKILFLRQVCGTFSTDQVSLPTVKRPYKKGGLIRLFNTGPGTNIERVSRSMW